MSAHLCHDNQFVLLAVAYLIKDKMLCETVDYKLGPEMVMNVDAITMLNISGIKKLANTFKRANILSVNKRYTHLEEMQSKFTTVYLHTYSIIREWFREPDIFYIVLKAIDNYQYQCDEIDSWNNSKAKRLTDELYRKYSSFIIQKQPEWQKGKWGFDGK